MPKPHKVRQSLFVLLDIAFKCLDVQCLNKDNGLYCNYIFSEKRSANNGYKEN